MAEKTFVVDKEKLKGEQLVVLRAIQKAGQKHLSYYHESMAAFQHPERRVKTFDTVYYEEVMPIVIDILRNYENVE